MPTNAEALAKAAEAGFTGKAAKTFAANYLRGASDATCEMRGRMQQILSSDEARGREALAKHLALDSEMSASEAIQLLSRSPINASLSSRMGAHSPGIRSENWNEPEQHRPSGRVDSPSVIFARRAQSKSKGQK